MRIRLGLVASGTAIKFTQTNEREPSASRWTFKVREAARSVLDSSQKIQISTEAARTDTVPPFALKQKPILRTDGVRKVKFLLNKEI